MRCWEDVVIDIDDEPEDRSMECEHCGNEAPPGQRFCNMACQKCEATEPPPDAEDCAEICFREAP